MYAPKFGGRLCVRDVPIYKETRRRVNLYLSKRLIFLHFRRA